MGLNKQKDPKLKVLFATTNQGKHREIMELFKDQPVELLSLSQMPYISPCVEDGKSFFENAIKKAIYYSKAFQIPCISDDSGLEVAALGGRPGVHSARFGGADATDEMRNIMLLKELGDEVLREARFVCVIAIALPDGKFRTFEGTVEGEIARAPRGSHGFGYDPIFYYPPLGKTFAELTMEEKNKVSHRAKALELLKKEIPDLIQWLRSGSNST